jgi:hypothetical protein
MEDGPYIHTNNINVIPQNALTKFVRNISSLRWFRSDLMKENMTMLQLERPEIGIIELKEIKYSIT